jgi:hypothetical protein
MIVRVYNAKYKCYLDYVQSGPECKPGVYSTGGRPQLNTDAVDSRLL